MGSVSDQTTINYLNEIDNDNYATTNPIGKQPVQSYSINGSHVFVSVIEVIDDTNDPKENASVVLKIWDSNVSVLLNGTTELNGFVRFKIRKGPFSDEDELKKCFEFWLRSRRKLRGNKLWINSISR